MATVWAAAGVAVLLAAMVFGLCIGGVAVARHRAEAAADLAALAAAGVSVLGQQAACERAAMIATAMGGELSTCLLTGWDALVEVQVTVGLPIPLPGTGPAVGRAAAGPFVDQATGRTDPGRTDQQPG